MCNNKNEMKWNVVHMFFDLHFTRIKTIFFLRLVSFQSQLPNYYFNIRFSAFLNRLWCAESITKQAKRGTEREKEMRLFLSCVEFRSRYSILSFFRFLSASSTFGVAQPSHSNRQRSSAAFCLIFLPFFVALCLFEYEISIEERLSSRFVLFFQFVLSLWFRFHMFFFL